jgi:hypothetical protein
MKLDYTVSLTIDISKPTLKGISEAYFRLSVLVLSDFFATVLRSFAQQYMSRKPSPLTASAAAIEVI